MRSAILILSLSTFFTTQAFASCQSIYKEELEYVNEQILEAGYGMGIFLVILGLGATMPSAGVATTVNSEIQESRIEVLDQIDLARSSGIYGIDFQDFYEDVVD